MPESQIHITLVESVLRTISNLLPNEGDRSSIQVDSPTSYCKPPRVYGNYQPDVYYISTDRLIIGEAKTDTDCEKKHSIKQYQAYMHECKRYGENATIVLGVFFYSFDTMANIFRILKKEENFLGKIIIIDSNERVIEL